MNVRVSYLNIPIHVFITKLNPFWVQYSHELTRVDLAVQSDGGSHCLSIRTDTVLSPMYENQFPMFDEEFCCVTPA